jgi:hypothetical protein
MQQHIARQIRVLGDSSVTTTIIGAGTLSPGVTLSSGGSVNNAGTIQGGSDYGVGVDGDGTITNAGTIQGNYRIWDWGDLYLSNSGVIIGSIEGVRSHYDATVTNWASGDIYGEIIGLYVDSTGSVTNAGSIGGYRAGIQLAVTGTVVNAGTITSTGAAGGPDSKYAAVVFKGTGENRLVVDPGALFNGGVYANASASNTLELGAGNATLAGFDTAFLNFQTIAVDAGANWALTGTESLSSFDATETILIPQDASLTYNGTAVVCFCIGTLIETPSGEIPVERLSVGDIVMTAHNGPRPVRWIGHGKVLATRGRRTAATPVIVRRGALADNVPNRDLHVTKAHGLYIDSVLIPVEFLVNHKTILWDDRAREVEIYHVELDSHDVLLANGAPAESFRDDGNRWLFHNARSGGDRPPQAPYAPVLTGGPVVDAAWRRLLDRAGPRYLPPMTDDPDLHLVVDGKRVDAVATTDAVPGDGSVMVFRLQGAPRSIHLVSREVVPAEWGIARDPRPLGVALRRITVRQGTRLDVLPASDARLADGFHEYEASGDLRWTDGDATLAAALFARFRGATELVLTLAATTMYPDPGESLTTTAA